LNPTERVRIVTETARAVIDGRLEPVTGARALLMQQEQIAPHLRSDRIDVTQSEADTVALTLRRLGEQVADLPVGAADAPACLEMARVLGELAQTLR